MKGMDGDRALTSEMEMWVGVGERGSQTRLWGGTLHRTDSGTAVEGCTGLVPGWGFMDSDKLESHRGLLTLGVT